MSRTHFYQPDTGSRWSYRVVGLSLLVTLGIFLMLPIAEMLYQQIPQTPNWAIRQQVLKNHI